MSSRDYNKSDYTASRIQVQTEWNVSALKFLSFFFKLRALYTSTFGGRRLYENDEKVTRVIEMERDASLSPISGEAEISARSPSAASAAIPARDLTFTVTQGNQLRNKLSFYRILNLASHPGGAWIIKGPKREASLPPQKEKFRATGRNCSSRDQRASRTTDRRITLMSYCSFFEIASLSHCVYVNVVYNGRETNNYADVTIGIE